MESGIASAQRRGRGQGIGAPVFETLREDILAFRLAPGAVLSRADLQGRFGVSSTPVRDALLRLQEEGLVQIFPQHATRVSPIDLDRARQAQFLRRAVELELVRGLAAEPDPALVDRLRALVRKQGALAAVDEYEAFTEADQAFHRAMYEAAGLGELWPLVRRQGGHIDRLRRLHLPVAGKMRDVLRDHAAIVDAIEAGKPKRAPRRPARPSLALARLRGQPAGEPPGLLRLSAPRPGRGPRIRADAPAGPIIPPRKRAATSAAQVKGGNAQGGQ